MAAADRFNKSSYIGKGTRTSIDRFSPCREVVSFISPYCFYNWATDAVAYFARKTDDTAMKTVFDGLDDKEALQAIGAAIRSMRKERGISQEALSHLW